jgi:hypothetical protein
VLILIVIGFINKDVLHVLGKKLLKVCFIQSWNLNDFIVE